MDQRDLNALIRMAAEVDTLEQDSAHSFQWAKAKTSRREVLMQRMTGIGALAAAACLGLMVVSWLRAPQAQPSHTAMNTEKPAAPTVVASATPDTVKNVESAAEATPAKPEEGSVLLAVFHDANDMCSYVQLHKDALHGRKLTEVGGGELLRTAIAANCQDNPERVLVLAMTGPKDLLPRSTAEAEVLASCISEGGRCGDDSGCYVNNAADYLPPGVTVVAETMGMGPR